MPSHLVGGARIEGWGRHTQNIDEINSIKIVF